MSAEEEVEVSERQTQKMAEELQPILVGSFSIGRLGRQRVACVRSVLVVLTFLPCYIFHHPILQDALAQMSAAAQEISDAQRQLGP